MPNRKKAIHYRYNPKNAGNSSEAWQMLFAIMGYIGGVVWFCYEVGQQMKHY